MIDPWARRITRAQELAEQDGPGRVLLTSYCQLLRLQKDCYAELMAAAPSLTGRLDDDLPALVAGAERLLAGLRQGGPRHVVAEATQLLAQDRSAVREMVRQGWDDDNRGLIARLVLQPYAECLAHLNRRPAGRDADGGARCPFCAGPPQLSILRGDAALEGGGRSLQCALCATTWIFRRVLCAGCGEEDERRLGYFRAPEFDHLRVDACDSCGRYLKGVDLTRLGRAVPLVDEVAGAPLDLWARERGYRKIALNLVGL